MAESLRIEKLNKLFRSELGGIIAREVDFEEGALVTITHVDVHRNLSHAEVFFTVLPETKGNAALRTLNESVFEIQQTLNKRLKMRPVPKVVFKLDKGQLKAEEVYRVKDETEK